MEKNEWIEAGKIINTHGIAGEVKIEIWLDSPAFFKKFKRVLLEEKEVKVLAVREHKGFAITKLEGVDDMNGAQRLKEKTVYINREDAHLPKGSYFLADIIGSEVVDESGTVIGTLAEVFETPANPVYVVKGETEHLIPAVPEFILNTDPEAKRITVHLIKGL